MTTLPIKVVGPGLLEIIPKLHESTYSHAQREFNPRTSTVNSDLLVIVDANPIVIRVSIIDAYQFITFNQISYVILTLNTQCYDNSEGSKNIKLECKKEQINEISKLLNSVMAKQSSTLIKDVADLRKIIIDSIQDKKEEKQKSVTKSIQEEKPKSVTKSILKGFAV